MVKERLHFANKLTFDKIPEMFNNYFVNKIAKIRSLLDSTTLYTIDGNCVPSCNSVSLTDLIASHQV